MLTPINFFYPAQKKFMDTDSVPVQLTKLIEGNPLSLDHSYFKESMQKHEVHRIGDYNVSGLIADAVFAGHHLDSYLRAQSNDIEKNLVIFKCPPVFLAIYYKRAENYNYG